MKRIRNKLNYFAAFVCIALGLWLCGCASSGGRSWAQKRGDDQVASNVKKELSKDSKSTYRDVGAVVYDGTVQLVGFIDTPEQKTRATDLALRAKGVREVVNSIAVKPTPTGPNFSNTNAPAETPAGETSPPASQAPGIPEPAPTPNP